MTLGTLESLEDRLTPAVFTPHDVPGLIAAIAASNATAEDDTIELDPGATYTLTTVQNTTDGFNGLPVIATGAYTLTINGHGATLQRSAAAGTPAFRLLDVGAGSTVVVSDLTVANGLQSGDALMSGMPFNAYGGGITNAGNLTLRGVTVRDNVARGRDAFAQGTWGQPGLAGGDALGGGIYSTGSLTLTAGTKLINNQSIAGAGGVGFPGFTSPYTSPTRGGNGGLAYGGGVYAAGRLTVDTAEFRSNLAVGGAGALGLTNTSIEGGGVFGSAGGAGGLGSGGAIQMNFGELHVDSGLFQGNLARGGVGGVGGAGSPGVPVQSIAFSPGGDGGAGGAGGAAYGGAIGLLGGSASSVARSTFLSNAVQAGDGGRGASGGSVNLDPFLINSSMVSSGGSGGAGGTGGAAAGGAILTDLGATLSVDAATLDGNTAQGGVGGAGGAGGRGSNTRFNVQPGPGGNGGAGGAGGLGEGAGLFVGRAVVTSSSSDLTSNLARASAGGTGGAGGSGGGSTFGVSGNPGVAGAAGVIGAGRAAAISNGIDGRVTLVDVEVSRNTAATAAGAIDNQGQLTVERSTMAENVVQSANGSAIDLRAGQALFRNATVSGNAGTGVAGVNFRGGTLNALNATITANAGPGIAGLSSTSSLATLVNTVVAANGGTDLLNVGLASGSRNNAIGGDPKLGPLADNGGPTRTHLPLPGSPLLEVGAVDAVLAAGLTTDQRGKTRVSGAMVDIGAVEVQAASVSGVDLNTGGAQRSRVNGPFVVSLAPGDAPAALPDASAFRLVRQQDGRAFDVAVQDLGFADGVRKVRLILAGPGLEAGSLPDGRYALTALSSGIRDQAYGLPMSVDVTTAFHRFFGDVNGDAVVDATDYLAFRLAYQGGSVGASNWYFDADGDGQFTLADLQAFNQRFVKRRLG